MEKVNHSKIISLFVAFCAILYSFTGTAQFDYDIEISSISTTNDTCPGDSNYVFTIVKNVGTQSIDSFMLVWEINSVVDSQWVHIPLNSGDLTFTYLPGDFVVDTGLNEIFIRTKLSDINPDQNVFNDSSNIKFHIKPPRFLFWGYCVNFYVGVFKIETENTHNVLWDFEDGTLSTENNPTHMFPWSPSNPIFYNVSATIYNFCGNFIDSTTSVPVPSNSGNFGPCATSTNEIISHSNIQIYPNPSSEQISIELEAPRPTSTKLSMYSFNGTLLYSYESDESSTNLTKIIDVSAFPKGLYLIKVDTEYDSQNFKVIVN